MLPKFAALVPQRWQHIHWERSEDHDPVQLQPRWNGRRLTNVSEVTTRGEVEHSCCQNYYGSLSRATTQLGDSSRTTPAPRREVVEVHAPDEEAERSPRRHVPRRDDAQATTAEHEDQLPPILKKVSAFACKVYSLQHPSQIRYNYDQTKKLRIFMLNVPFSRLSGHFWNQAGHF